MPADNTNGDYVSNDQFLDYARQYRTQRRKCDEENGILRSIVKRAKSDGINTKKMISSVQASKLEQAEVEKDLRDEVRYLSLLRMPIEADSIFGGWDGEVTNKTQAEDDIWTAEDAGYKAGRHGVSIDDCPYIPGTEAYTHWRDHWGKGQEAIAREMGPNSKVASTSVKPRAKADKASTPRAKHRRVRPNGGTSEASPVH